jgi:predicted lipase
MWNGIRDNVTRDLLSIRNETGVNKLYITGISLGGALACLSFIDLHHDHVFDSIKVVTFGAPRVGNKRWAKFFNALTNTESRRYLIKGDPISVLPECITFFCNYRHTGIKIVCNKKKNLCTQEK